MRILICSNGMPAADEASRIGGLVAAACRAETTLFGIAEKPADETPLREALQAEAERLRDHGVTPNIIVRAGEPIQHILAATSDSKYDLVIIGAERRGTSGLYWRSEKTYEVIKAIRPPVLVAIGQLTELKRFLVCTGGKEFIGAALQLTGEMAVAMGASVTLLHVMAEPPAMYADLVQMEEDLDRLLESKSELAKNLRRQKDGLERIGVPTEVRIRHGIVLDQVFAEARQGTHDLIVTGSSQSGGMLQHYIMGDISRTILNHTNCPVLISRSGKLSHFGIWQSIKQAFGTARE
jgi:nucleotide-binding universal stress UspA family protein